MICATGSHTKKTMACWLHSSYSNNFIGEEKKEETEKRTKKGRNNKLKKTKRQKIVQQKKKILKAQTQKLHTSPKVLTREYIKRGRQKLWNAECWAA